MSYSKHDDQQRHITARRAQVEHTEQGVTLQACAKVRRDHIFR